MDLCERRVEWGLVMFSPRSLRGLLASIVSGRGRVIIGHRCEFFRETGGLLFRMIGQLGGANRWWCRGNIRRWGGWRWSKWGWRRRCRVLLTVFEILLPFQLPLVLQNVLFLLQERKIDENSNINWCSHVPQPFLSLPTTKPTIIYRGVHYWWWGFKRHSLARIHKANCCYILILCWFYKSVVCISCLCVLL